MLGGTSGAVDEFAARLPPETPLAVLLDADAHQQAIRLVSQIALIREVIHLQLPRGDPAAFMPSVLRTWVLNKLQELGGTAKAVGAYCMNNLKG